jgi:hypothetical protein
MQLEKSSSIQTVSEHLNVREPFLLPLFKRVYDQRFNILDSFLRALVRKQRFESEYNSFLIKVKAQEEEKRKRMNLTLEQIYGKFVDKCVSDSSSAPPKVDTLLENYLSLQFARLVPHVEREFRLRQFVRTDIYDEQQFLPYKSQRPSLYRKLETIMKHSDERNEVTSSINHKLLEAYNFLKEENAIRAEDMENMETFMLQQLVHNRELNAELQLLKKRKMILEARMGIVDLGSPLWSGRKVALELMKKQERTEKKEMEAANSKKEEEPIVITDSLREEHRILFFSLLQYVTEYVVFPQLVEKSLAKYAKRKSSQLIAQLIAQCDTPGMKQMFLQRLFEMSIPILYIQSNSLLRDITRLTTLYYEEYKFHCRENRFFEMLTNFKINKPE